MRQKLVFFIALTLALTQGIAAQGVRSTEAFTNYVGQQITRTVDLTIATLETPIDPDPDPPVVDRSSGESDLSRMIRSSIVTDDLFIHIEGNDSLMFSAEIIWGAISIITNEVTVRVNITYSPSEEGIHKATLKVLDDLGTSHASVRLYGEAMLIKGDADRDGQVSVADITALIDYILKGDESGIYLAAADVDGDGNITVADVSELIDVLLGVPQTKMCTYLIITKTSGLTREYLIDENSKVKIEPDENTKTKLLSIETGDQVIVFNSNELVQLRYEQREVSINNKLANIPASEDMIEAESVTLNTEKP